PPKPEGPFAKTDQNPSSGYQPTAPRSDREIASPQQVRGFGKIEIPRAPQVEKRSTGLSAWIWSLVILGVAWAVMSIGAAQHHYATHQISKDKKDEVMWRTSTKILVLAGTFFLFTVDVTTAAEVPVHAVVINPKSFDHQTLTLQGTAAAVKESTSHRGNDYT